MTNSHALQVHHHVSAALATGQPVVALESTVITHGLPRPGNRAVAAAVEAAVRESGALPATIGVVGGIARIGLTGREMDSLAASTTARKVGPRDLPLVLARGEDGGTTVAATLWLAHRAGIQVFATGGIGGVHRGAPFDISADLGALAATPLTVVCSGAKSVLDLPATLEALETRGVPVVGFGTETLPAFTSPDSGLPVPARVDDMAALADIVRARNALGTPQAVLVTVPVPSADALDDTEAESAAAHAAREASQRGITGPAVTPWVLNRMVELTDGRSLRANRALLVNNARIAAQLAVALTTR
jgi:pseudouridine-5'-phosphate glycosidase